MTHPNQDSPRRRGSELARAGKTALLMLPLALALSAAGYHPAQAQTQAAAPSCTVALNALVAEWQSIGFAEPGKPAQMIVRGRHGYTTTAGRFYFLRQQIRDSARDCEAGRDVEALQNIAMTRTALGHQGQGIQYGD